MTQAFGVAHADRDARVVAPRSATRSATPVLERLGEGQSASARAPAPERQGQIPQGDDVEPMRVSVGLLFSYDGAVMFDEGGGGSVRNSLDVVAGSMKATAEARRMRNGRGAFEPPRALPPITAWPIVD